MMMMLMRRVNDDGSYQNDDVADDGENDQNDYDEDDKDDDGEDDERDSDYDEDDDDDGDDGASLYPAATSQPCATSCW